MGQYLTDWDLHEAEVVSPSRAETREVAVNAHGKELGSAMGSYLE
jgi:hypothetical protein